MRILLVETTQYAPTSPLFLETVREVGDDHRFVDEAPYLRSLGTSPLHKAAFRILGRRPLTYWRFNRDFLDEAARFRPAVVLVVKGAYIMPATLARIKEATGARLINYATDDPFNQRVSTPSLVQAIANYDVYACTKRAIMDDVMRAGARIVTYTRFAYKPSLHFPELPATPEEARLFSSDVAFVGGADADRLPYFEPLARDRGLRLALYGGYWSRYELFRPLARGMAVGRAYRLALGGAKIAVCLVRRANRDGHVMRSFEIPACGAFMLAERTEEHGELFREGREAVFFGSPEELRDKARYYLAHDDERAAIARAGHARITAGGHTYTDRLKEMLAALDPVPPLATPGRYTAEATTSDPSVADAARVADGSPPTGDRRTRNLDDQAGPLPGRIRRSR